QGVRYQARSRHADRYSAASYLGHPVRLPDSLELHIHDDPRTHHIRKDFAIARLAHTPARPVTHKFRAFGLFFGAWDGRTVMNASRRTGERRFGSDQLVHQRPSM